MKRLSIALFAGAVALGLAVQDAEAARLGGSRSFGMSRNTTTMKQATPAPAPATPTQSAAPAAKPAPAAAPAAAPQPSGMSRWLGPIAGLAAGIGLAALLSHFGLGEGVTSFLMMALLVFAVIFAVRLLFRKRQPEGQMQYAGAGSPAAESISRFEPVAPVAGGGAAATAAVPAEFDTEGFLRQAKLNFIRLQAANDAGNMEDLKAFTSPEVFAEIQMQYEERGRAKQETDVIQLNAELLELATEADQHVASVRFFGQIRESAGGAADAFQEIWHLAKPTDGSRGWVIAGIQQVQ